MGLLMPNKKEGVWSFSIASYRYAVFDFTHCIISAQPIAVKYIIFRSRIEFEISVLLDCCQIKLSRERMRWGHIAAPACVAGAPVGGKTNVYFKTLFIRPTFASPLISAFSR